MKLIPKAKPVRIRISAGGQEHTSLETLYKCYDIESLLQLYINGTLTRWLNQIGEYDIAERLKNLQIVDTNNVTDAELGNFARGFYKEKISLAAREIAHSYENSENGEQILLWHQIAYESGNLDSCYELGLIYERGLFGVRKNQKESFKFLKIAAEYGNADALCDLSWYYYKGVCVEESVTEAMSLLEQSANSGHIRSYFRLAMILKSEGRFKEAHKWCEAAINAGIELGVNSLEMIAELYDNISGCESQCHEYYLQAAKLGSLSAQLEIGHHYRTGFFVKQDLNQAQYWYKRVADSGNADGQYFMGLHYWQKEERDYQDVEDAMKWFKMAVSQNHNPAKVILALCHGSKGEYNIAMELMTEAAKANYSEAQFLLGIAYEEGMWGRKNRNTAISWYKKAADNGYLPEAIDELKRLGVDYTK